MELDVSEVNGEGEKRMGWEYRLDCEGPQALWSGIWSLEFGFYWAACPGREFGRYWGRVW